MKSDIALNNLKTDIHTAIERSTARIKSIFSTITLLVLPANKAASFTKFARSALHKDQQSESVKPSFYREMRERREAIGPLTQ